MPKKRHLFFVRLAIISFFFISATCLASGAPSVNSTTDSTFIRAQALVKYRQLVSTSFSGENVTLDSTSSLVINKTPSSSEQIGVDINIYSITDSGGLHPQNIACGSSLNYGVYCTNYFGSTTLTEAQNNYLAYRLLEEYFVNIAKANFFTSYNYTLLPINTADQSVPNVIFYTTFTGYPSSGTYNVGTHELWIASFDEFKSAIANDANNVCDDPSSAVYRFYELFGLPPDVPGTSDRYFVLANLPVQQSTVTTTGIFRPCTSFDITSTTCATPLSFSSIPTGEEQYYSWVAGQYKWAYVDTTNTDSAHYPWSAQGFTYNWYPWRSNAYGLSEYVVAKNTNIYINSKQTITQILNAYCPSGSNYQGHHSSSSSPWGTIAIVAGGAAVVGTGGYLIAQSATSKAQPVSTDVSANATTTGE